MSKSLIDSLTLHELAEMYVDQAEQIDRMDEAAEVSNALVYRDLVAQRLEREQPTGETAAIIARADRQIESLAPQLYRRHPQVFDDNRDSVPDDYWWWKLGPGEEARAR